MNEIPKSFQASLERLMQNAAEGKPALPVVTRSKGRVVNIPKRFSTGTPPEQVVASFKRLAPLAELWASGEELGWPGYLMHGGLGVGKTGVACLLAEHIAEHGRKHVGFTLLWDLVSEVKATWGDSSEVEERSAIKRWCEPDLLVIDEVGVQFATLAERNILYRIVVGRHNDLKPTIITTNSNLNTDTGRAEFYDAVGVRVASRFEGFLVDADEWGGNLRSRRSQ